MTSTAELRRRAEALASELADIRDEIRRVEEDRFVRVQFPGNTRSYTYEMAPGHGADVGDYVCVFSPYTGVNELVRVAYKGRQGWMGPTKIARAVRILVQPSGVDLVTHLGAIEWDPFR